MSVLACWKAPSDTSRETHERRKTTNSQRASIKRPIHTTELTVTRHEAFFLCTRSTVIINPKLSPKFEYMSLSLPTLSRIVHTFHEKHNSNDFQIISKKIGTFYSYAKINLYLILLNSSDVLLYEISNFESPLRAAVSRFEIYR